MSRHGHGGFGGAIGHGTHTLEGFGEAALHFAHRAAVSTHFLQEGLEHIGHAIEHAAKEMHGHYQQAHGPHPAWAQLAQSTQDERVRLGYTANDPLLRSGQMQRDISHGVDGLDVVIGSVNEHAPVHELGSRDGTIPPRPTLGPAAFLNKELISRYAGNAAVNAFVGRSLLFGRGYDDETTPPQINTG